MRSLLVLIIAQVILVSGSNASDEIYIGYYRIACAQHYDPVMCLPDETSVQGKQKIVWSTHKASTPQIPIDDWVWQGQLQHPEFQQAYYARVSITRYQLPSTPLYHVEFGVSHQPEVSYGGVTTQELWLTDLSQIGQRGFTAENVQFLGLSNELLLYSFSMYVGAQPFTLNAQNTNQALDTVFVGYDSIFHPYFSKEFLQVSPRLNQVSGNETPLFIDKLKRIRIVAEHAFYIKDKNKRTKPPILWPKKEEQRGLELIRQATASLNVDEEVAHNRHLVDALYSSPPELQAKPHRNPLSDLYTAEELADFALKRSRLEPQIVADLMHLEQIISSATGNTVQIESAFSELTNKYIEYFINDGHWLLLGDDVFERYLAVYNFVISN